MVDQDHAVNMEFRFTSEGGMLLPGPSALRTAGGISAGIGSLYQLDSSRVAMNGNEEIGRFVSCQQTIRLDRVGTGSGIVSLLLQEHSGNSVPLHIDINGHMTELQPREMPQGTFHWRSTELPEGVLRPGSNTVQVTASNLALNSWAWGVSVAPSRNGSTKSWDEGATWHDSLLGVNGTYQGDYAARWWLPVAPSQAYVYGPALTSKNPFHLKAKPTINSEASGPLQVRVGRMLKGQITWESWRPLEETDAAEVQQLRAVIDPSVSFRALDVSTDRPVEVYETTAYDLVLDRQDSPPVEAIRSYFDIDWTALAELDDLQLGRSLCSEVHRLWVHEVGDGGAYSPFHAPTITAWQDDGTHGRATAMCVHFSVVLAQLATAAGLKARCVILGKAEGEGFGPGVSGHFVAEIFSRQLQRWVCFDADFDHYWEVSGEPAGVMDIHEAWNEKQLDQIGIRRGQAIMQNPYGETWPLDHLRGGGFSWFGIPLRQSWLEDPASRLGHHGSVDYHESDVLWWHTTPNARHLYPWVTDEPEEIRRLGAPPRPWASGMNSKS